MVTSFERDDAPGVEFVLRPNRSLNWRAAQAAFLTLCGCTAAIAAYFASQGAWLVLPFAGLELLAVGACLYVCLLTTHSREVVRINDREIVIQRGRHRPAIEQRIPRAWTRVVLATDSRNWYPSRLLLRSYGRETEIGRHLIEEERRELAAELGRYLTFFSRNRLHATSPFSHLETKGRLPPVEGLLCSKLCIKPNRY
ncbi:MAG: DUF2244 domain-containing protein [Pseudomonadota bacterium]|nr:MAG: DUF2244 domain-containing protein [Pseudomonadota bacterium]